MNRPSSPFAGEPRPLVPWWVIWPLFWLALSGAVAWVYMAYRLLAWLLGI